MVDMSKHMRDTLQNVPSQKIFDFSQFTSTIDDIIQLTIGEPDFNTPEHIKQAGIQAINDNHTHYAPQRGTAGLLKAVSDYLKDTTGVDYDPKTQILVTNGVTEGAFAALNAIVNPGDVVLVPTPTFSIYTADVAIAGGTAVEVDTSPANFRLTPELLKPYLDKYGDRVKAIVVVNPSNPTGVAMNQAELDAIADLVRDKNIFILADEIYSELWYAGEAASITKALPEQTILVNGLSKSYAMTGWRVGYLAAPQDVVAKIFKVHAFAVTDVATFVQDAAQEALTNGRTDYQPMEQAYIKRRDVMKAALQKMGWQCTAPQGAFYIFARIPAYLDQNDEDLAYDMAKTAKVAATPGSYFGKGGEHYMRFSYATALDKIKVAMERLAKYCQNHQE
ncbi:pyridoxal phosphate-dependent aminotransferase [uncultured Limosilactobacillus sp.]|uniref:pyridoxal phosphate-dependent aminotransferase n=1 Tax=uncultured Limosilactobacillus sp. TaxID=2837629 RepID=UPI0025E2904D|nr:aminotransferase class I/II-fold pyridoxal phosphate-dependent enzyme [uncultured Limosilactobacillus sp.]